MVDDLPHFLLLLPILQRFDDAKWGYFTECPQSGVKLEPVENLTTYSFSGVEEAAGPRIRVFFHSEHHRIYLGTTLIGCGTGVIGGRMGPLPESTELCNVKKLQQENDLVVKTYWPEENRTSEVEILKKAREYGERSTSSGTTSRRWFTTWIRTSLAVRRRQSDSSSVSLLTAPVACV